MEYKLYKHIRKYRIPKIIRIIIAIIFIIMGIISIILPLPLSVPTGIFLIIIGITFIISIKSIKFVKKLRKSLIHFFKNIHIKQTRQHKIKDIKKHIKQILKNN